MDLTQLLVTVVAVVGILITAAMAVVPTVLQFHEPEAAPTSSDRDLPARTGAAGPGRNRFVSAGRVRSA